jgi:hypothetical protein
VSGMGTSSVCRFSGTGNEGLANTMALSGRGLSFLRIYNGIHCFFKPASQLTTTVMGAPLCIRDAYFRCNTNATY